MNNTDKKQYLDNLMTLYSYKKKGIKVKEEEFPHKPRRLYKYKKFDEYTSDMLSENYAYLCKASILDDPFDCLINMMDSAAYEINNEKYKEDIIEEITKRCCLYSKNNSNINNLKNIFRKYWDNGHISKIILYNEIMKEVDCSPKELHAFVGALDNLKDILYSAKEYNQLEDVISKFHNIKDKIGVCSLATRKDNKPLWSLYTDNYKGYCIEYDSSFYYDLDSVLVPVIYLKKYDNNGYSRIIKFLIYSFIDSYLKKNETDLGELVEVFCIKDSDWKYQNEWRIIGDAENKIYSMPIKSIYLGFDVSVDNEDEVLKIAKEKGYNVYKMKKPCDIRICYEKIL